MNEKRGDATAPADVPYGDAVVQLLADANGEAGRLQHEYVGTEHLLLALTRRPDLASTLIALAVEPTRVDRLINDTIRRGRDSKPVDFARPFTSRTKEALRLAATTASELGHPNVGPAHVIAGLMREGSNIAAQVLADQGVTEQRAYEHTREHGSPDQHA